jgi:hypothetical protein
MKALDAVMSAEIVRKGGAFAPLFCVKSMGFREGYGL